MTGNPLLAALEERAAGYGALRRSAQTAIVLDKAAAEIRAITSDRDEWRRLAEKRALMLHDAACAAQALKDEFAASKHSDCGHWS